MIDQAVETVQFVLQGYCEGAHPVDGIESLLNEAWYSELISLIKAGDSENAIALAKQNFTAEYIPENVQQFEDNGVIFIETLDTGLVNPYLENDDEHDIPLFKWIGANFLMEAPREVIEEWLEKNEDGSRAFSQDKFDDWFGTDNELQDGCCYNLGTSWYDLDGLGENGCKIDTNLLIKEINGG
jgi:hypothetical protein